MEIPKPFAFALIGTLSLIGASFILYQFVSVTQTEIGRIVNAIVVLVLLALGLVAGASANIIGDNKTEQRFGSALYIAGGVLAWGLFELIRMDEGAAYVPAIITIAATLMITTAAGYVAHLVQTND